MTANCVPASWRKALHERDRERRNADRPFQLTRLNKDGSPSRMSDATEHFATQVEALKAGAYRRELNAPRVIRYALNGREI